MSQSMPTWEDLGFSPFLERQTPLENKAPGSLGDFASNKISDSDMDARLSTLQTDVRIPNQESSDTTISYTVNAGVTTFGFYTNTVNPSDAKFFFIPFYSIYVDTDNDPAYLLRNGAGLTNDQKVCDYQVINDAHYGERYFAGKYITNTTLANYGSAQHTYYVHVKNRFINLQS